MNNVLQIPTEYNMQTSLLRAYEKAISDNDRLRKKCNRLIAQKRFWFVITLISATLNVAFIYFIADALFQGIRLAG